MISATAAFGLCASMLTASPSLAAEGLLAQAAPILALDAGLIANDDQAEDLASPEQQPVATLASLVEQQARADTADEEELCLAESVYFEAKGEPLAGQLAVAETVINRAGSGRFPASLCGVVRQPGQFSFVRGGHVPDVDHDSRAWRQAVAVARIARAEMWKDVAPNALYFHASRVSPRWGGAKRIAQLGNHVFYR